MDTHYGKLRFFKSRENRVVDISRNSIWPERKALIDYYNEVYLIQDEINQHVQSSKQSEIEYGEELSKLIKNAPNGHRALDIGCGTGELAYKLLDKYDEVHGTEISLKCLNIARNKYPDINFRLVSDMILPYPDDFFDIVVANQVIEHIYPNENHLFFKEIHRVLKSDGMAILSTPNGDELRRKALWIPVVVLSFLLNKPETFIASKLYFIHNSILSRGTAKSKLFKKYQFLEHINLVSLNDIEFFSKQAGLKIISCYFDGFRPIFSRLYSSSLLNVLARIEKELKYFRRELMSNMTILMKKR